MMMMMSTFILEEPGFTESYCISLYFLISNLKISTSLRILSSSGTIFHTLGAKYSREFKPKSVVLRELRENQFETLSYILNIS